MSTGEKDVWSLDEVHFQQYGSRCRMWVPPETQDPILLHHPGRKSVGYFGAVRLRDGKFVSHRQTGRFNGESFYVFLKRLRRITARSPSPVVVLADNASYHHAKLHQPWRERASQRFALDYLPPYSPDLNPIERVWKLTRRTCVHNRYFPKLEEVINAVDELFSTWAKGNDTLRRLCAITYGAVYNNCPYDAISMHDTGGQWGLDALPKALRGQDRMSASKCDLCYTSESGPACVRNCPQGCASRVGSTEEFQQLLAKRD